MLNAASPANTFFSRVNGVQRSVSYSSAQDAENNTSEIRRGQSLRVPGNHGGPRRDLGLSFGAAGDNLGSTPPSPNFSPPAASRHPLFSHHASPLLPTSSPITIPVDADISCPPSPSSISSGAFSPASAFLSHFSSQSSLRPSVTMPDAAGAQVLDYVLGKILGRGGFSTVRLATHVGSGEVFACKIVKRDDLSDRSGSLEKFEEEINIWKSFPRHSSLLPLLQMHRTSFATFLVIPFMPGGSLLDVLRREGGSESTARRWLPGIVKAVSALHDGFEGFEGSTLHGDLKLDNFLVDHAGGVMLCDFYMSRRLNATPSVPIPKPFGKSLIRKGRQSSPFPSNKEHRLVPDFPSASLPYAPPELLRAPPAGPALPQDIWSLGIILYALLTSKLPFADQFDPRLQMKILRGVYDDPLVGREWLECLRGCLDGNVETRWTISQVRECDAVAGWREVRSRSKARSKSRSRSRFRGPSSLAAPRDPSSSRSPEFDSFVPSYRRRPDHSPTDSRSRSSGRQHVASISYEPSLRDLGEDMVTGIEDLSIIRGRSAVRDVPPIQTAFPPAGPSRQPTAVLESALTLTPASTLTPSMHHLTGVSPIRPRSRSPIALTGFPVTSPTDVTSQSHSSRSRSRASVSPEDATRGRSRRTDSRSQRTVDDTGWSTSRSRSRRPER